MSQSKLKIKEIFYSLQGEAKFSGLPTIFIRLTGCPLRCGYCDTAYAFHGGKNLEISDIVTEIAKYPTKLICVTGGEPLAQQNCPNLIKALCDLKYEVSVETSGALDIGVIDQRATTIMDLKTPDSGECEKNLWDNIEKLTAKDQVKFVICSLKDYQWVKTILAQYTKLEQIECLISPCYKNINIQELAEWILQDGLKLRMQVQLHKVIWGDVPGK